MATERTRDEATKANEAMDGAFNKDDGPRSAGFDKERQPDADDIKDKAAENAADAALVRRPFP
jgi:hypothetical protein